MFGLWKFPETCGIFRRSCIKLAFMSDQTGDAAPVKVLVSPTVSQHKRLVFFLFFQLLYERGIHPQTFKGSSPRFGVLPAGYRQAIRVQSHPGFVISYIFFP